MPKKRKLDATLPADLPEETPNTVGGLGGFWGGSTTNMLQSRLKEVQASVGASILNGVTAIEIDPSQIDDEVGTDRLGGWQEDEAFQILAKDIERRGQRQPIRVRPADPSWAPAPEAPFGKNARFILQSGRRRLAAATELGLQVWAVISTDMGDQKLADLEERFLENTMRSDLSGFEQLLSIGLIAQSHKDLSQAEIAQRLGVPPGDVSLGLSCVELHDEITQSVDVASAPKRQYRELIPKLRGPEGKRGRGSKSKTPKSEPALKREAGDLTLTVSPTKNGLSLTVTGREFGFLDMEKMANVIAAAVKGIETKE
ncbi:MAG: ParB N-terminal domain-containing protein [Mangrovicoccus sp.]